MQKFKLALLMCACACSFLSACNSKNNGHTQKVESLLREDINNSHYGIYSCKTIKLDVYYVDLVKDIAFSWYDPEQKRTLYEEGDFELYYAQYSFVCFIEEHKIATATVFSCEISVLYSPELNKYEEVWHKDL